MSLSFRQQLLYPFLVALLGFGLASFVDVSNLPQQPFYEPFTYTLLAIGLYGSVHGIHRAELRNHREIILRAVTIGVLLKILIIGGILYLFTGKLTAFLMGLAVAQIDPLSVANLIQGQDHKLSERAQTILGAWSSFDDPMTVLLSIYALYLFLPHAANASLLELSLPFLLSLGLNLTFAGLVAVLARWSKNYQSWQLLLLGVSFGVAIAFKWMLGIAIIGLFLRPEIKKLPQIISVAFYLALLLLGFLLVNGISWLTGLALGLGAILAQVIAGFLLTRGLSFSERLYLAFAQQNGITAMILALLFEKSLPETVSIVAPAILFINLGYFLTNRFLIAPSLTKAAESVH
jgi:NhaP-type Na+/H+ or K+/H+ antiporter